MKIEATWNFVSSEKIELRSPRSGEGAQLLKYFQSLFHGSSEFLNFPSDYYDNRSAEEQESFIRNFNNDKLSFALFAFVEDQPIGHLVVKNFGFERAEHRANLVIGVLKQWQKKGIGGLMLDIAINQAEAIEIMSLELRVKKINESAIRLYIKKGFDKVGCVNGAARHGEDFFSEFIFVRNSQKLINLLKGEDFESKDQKFR